MNIDIFTGVNWSVPSRQNIIDLYVARMDLISYGVGFHVSNGYEPSPMLVDDTRSAIMSYTGLTIERYDALIEEAVVFLGEDGIPELFLSDTYWEAWSVTYEPSDDDREDAYYLVYNLYYKYITESQEISRRFFEIVKPRG